MKSKKVTFHFHELSTAAQLKAVIDYIKGWEETHDKDDMSLIEAVECCNDSDTLYTKTGKYSALNDN